MAITGTYAQPVLGGDGPIIEYAVKMHAFGQDSLWSHRLAKGLLTGVDMDGLAASLARFHADTAVASESSTWCSPPALQAIADETLDVIAQLLEEPQQVHTADALRRWEGRQRAALHHVFSERKARGCIRECHGDLHCGNILTLDHHVEAFDCIEFNDSLRWIDVMNDIAFTCMDLRFRKRGDLAAHLLNRYLELTGDYQGLRVLPYYDVHRALIRCKVALLRKAQCVPGSDAAEGAMQEALAYLEYASARSVPARPSLLIAHGFSGSGKSTVARMLVDAIDAVQLRSDVERKRMFGIPVCSHSAGGALYQADVTRQTYARLLDLAREVIESGMNLIVDATFLHAEQRQPFRELAAALGVPFGILDVRASEASMRARITERQRTGEDPSDAGLAVLEQQLRDHDPFMPEEAVHVLAIDTEAGVSAESLRAGVARLARGDVPPGRDLSY